MRARRALHPVDERAQSARGRRRGAALAAGALLVGLAAAGALREPPLRTPPAVPAARLPPPAASCAPGGAERAGVRIRGGEESARVARSALEQLFATETGARAREILRSGALRGPLTLEVNEHGDNFTPYRVPGRELGETIVFDPKTLARVETDRGTLAATPESVLAHELGHAVFKLRAEEDVIEEVENPVRRELGLPLRSRF